MSLREYFEDQKGTGVLSTASAEGEVDAAIYGRPRFVDEETVAFIMGNRLSLANLQSNPRAAYLFKEPDGYNGIRLHLTKLKEEWDPEKIHRLREERGFPGRGDYSDENKAVVTFRIDRTRPLVGENGE